MNNILIAETNGSSITQSLENALGASVGNWIYGIIGFLIWAAVVGFGLAGYFSWHKNHIKAGDEKQGRDKRPAWKDGALAFTGIGLVIIISIIAACTKQMAPEFYNQWMSCLTFHWIGAASTSA